VGFFIKAKSECFERFRQLYIQLQVQIGLKILALKTDRGEKFVSNNLLSFCDQEVIQKVFSQTYSPNQNGVVERRNRSLLEMARCMLLGKNVPTSLWAEAVNYSCYLQNRIPCRADPHSTPNTLFYDAVPDLSKVRELGTIAYLHQSVPNRDKLSSKTKLCIFVGIEESSGLYRLYEPASSRIHLSQDVDFHEHEHLPASDTAPVTDSSKSLLVIHSGISTPLFSPEVPSSIEHIQCPTSGPQDTTHEPLPDQSNSAAPGLLAPSLCRSNRQSVVSSKLSGFDFSLPGKRQDNISYIAALESTTAAPITYKAAQHHSDWKAAMDREISPVLKNDTWMLVDRPTDHPVITTRWVYKIKPGHQGVGMRFKARLVA
jgi:hypothetical protein